MTTVEKLQQESFLEAAPFGEAIKSKVKEKAKVLSPVLVVYNHSIWEMNQKPNNFRSYGMMELSASEVELRNIPRLMWNMLSFTEELASVSTDGFNA
uniref:Uncharacterized protein n=1 Tax=Cannabis sativa TaxID=3483 RepID=A0A803QBF0_CANSA